MNTPPDISAALTQPSSERAATVREVARFTAVGIISSVGYALVFIALTKGVGLHPQLANHLALIAAAVWSYYGHSRITFDYRGEHTSSAWKFATQIFVFYLLSGAVYFAIGHLGLDSIWGVAICLVLIPASSYAVMKLWTFAQPATD
jgi:putative flippase GtrA